MSAQGQTGATVVGTAPGAAAAAQTVKVTATITAIDRAKREVTVRAARWSFSSPDPAKNFTMTVGDQVTRRCRGADVEQKKAAAKRPA
jgi:hypothetical protein